MGSLTRTSGVVLNAPAVVAYGSVCSGIEAASVAWHDLGWRAAWFSEIEPYPCAVLTNHYPAVPNLGDMTAIAVQVLSGAVEPPDILVGGTPCQAFSVAGSRDSLSDTRGQLSLEFVRLANAIDTQRRIIGKPPAVVVWENVPGVLSTDDNAFGCFMAAIVGATEPIVPTGQRWTRAGVVHGPERKAAWRVLDAQFFGRPQRRKRVFVIASARDRCPSEVLFECEGLCWDFEESEVAGREPAAEFPSRLASGRNVVGTLLANAGTKQWLGNQEAFSGDYHIIEPVYGIPANWIGRAEINGGNGVQPSANLSPTLTKSDRHAVAFANGLHAHVRRLTPLECERLQGFPDGYTAVHFNGKPASDAVRYAALGNSMAVPVMRWIARRVQMLLECRNVSTAHINTGIVA